MYASALPPNGQTDFRGIKFSVAKPPPEDRRKRTKTLQLYVKLSGSVHACADFDEEVIVKLLDKSGSVSSNQPDMDCEEMGREYSEQEARSFGQTEGGGEESLPWNYLDIAKPEDARSSDRVP